MATEIEELDRELGDIEGDVDNGVELDLESEVEGDLESEAEGDLESEAEGDLKSEAERDLESELKSKLKDINRKMDITAITLSGASSNHNHKKMASKEPILALIIPNSLFSLWKRRREIEESLK